MKGACISYLALALALFSGCSRDRESRAARMTGGSPEVGKEEIAHHGCGGCHSIPGIRAAHALVGPPLDHMASRSYVAGMLPNTSENMRVWLMHPQQVKPGNAMPELGVGEAE